MPTPSPADSPKLNALTACRFFAAALVVVAHFQYTFSSEKAFHYFAFGQCVSFFFLLSGFILTLAYPTLDRLGAWGFIKKRWLRLWPMHIAALLLVLWLIPPIWTQSINHPDGGWILLANLALVQAWIPWQKYYFAFNIVSWSLSTEWAFYLLFPFLIHRFERTWPYKLAGAWAITTLTIAIMHYTHFPLFTPHAISTQGFLYVSPLGRIFEFVWGMTLTLAFTRLVRHRVLHPLWATLWEILAIIAVLSTSAWSHALIQLLLHHHLVSDIVAYTLECLWLNLLPLSALILLFALGRGYVSRLLQTRFMVTLGTLSFAIYMLHVTLIHFWLYPLRLKPHIPQPTTWQIAVFWLGLIGLSFVAHHVIEQHAWRKLVGRLPFRKSEQ